MCTGPMARHAIDLLPMLQILAEDNAPQLKLESEVDLGKLRVYWLEDDGGFPVITPVHRFPVRTSPPIPSANFQGASRGPAEASESAADRTPKHASGESSWSQRHVPFPSNLVCLRNPFHSPFPFSRMSAMSDEPLAPSFGAELTELKGEVCAPWELAK